MPISNVANALRRLALTALSFGFVSLGATATMAKPAYVGEWSTSARHCTPNDPVIELKVRTLLEVDAECRFRSITGGKGVWVARARCFGEASPAKTPVTITIWASAKRLTLKYSTGPARYNYERCR